MKNLICVLLFFFSHAIYAGVDQGGPKSVLINGVKENFIFKAPTPSKVTRMVNGSHYDYKLQGFELSVEKISYDPKLCKISEKLKTICQEKNVTYIVFKDKTTFKLTSQKENNSDKYYDFFINQIIQSFLKLKRR